ncbi:MAG: FAD/NAD(P)-binding protein [Planctomycetales bacterium]|nr:FAD/NAD(P)-binding protein [Planctomycetales bacterium]
MPAEIIQVDNEVPDVRTYHIALTNRDDAAGYTIRPGQFNMLYLPGIGEAAISASGDLRFSNPLIHTVRAVGNVTQSLARLQKSATLGIRGPFGSHWPTMECHGKDLILVAGGIGLAPLRPVIYEVVANREWFGNVWLLMGARSPDDLIYRSEYETWRSKGIDVLATVDQASSGWTGNVGFVTPLLDKLDLPDPSQTTVMTCGPEIMMRFAAQGSLAKGIPVEHIWVTLERNMKCAFGHCGHCQFGPHFVCKDGPVLRYDRVFELMGVDSL